MAREWAELHWEKIKYFLLKTSRCEEAKGEKKKQKNKKPCIMAAISLHSHFKYLRSYS